MKKLIAIIIIFLITIAMSCAGSSVGMGSKVGPYKNPNQEQWMIEYQRDFGHRGHDTRTPEPDEINNYCSICHHIY